MTARRSEANESEAQGLRRFLTTGGAGFVGGHIVAALRDRGAAVAVLDNLNTGHCAAVPPDMRLVEVDLADAHLLALSRLDTEPGVTWNLGCGAGHSVLEVIRSVERISGRAAPYRMAARRPGDPAVPVAASGRARAAGWRPRHEALDDIVRTAFAWREAHPSGYGGS